jgi:hypothetical protein
LQKWFNFFIVKTTQTFHKGINFILKDPIIARWPGIGPDIRNIYLFGKYRDFTYRKDNNPNGQLQSTTIYLRGK